MLNDLLKDFLIVSVSGAVLTLFLLILKPLIQNRFSARWYYYVWLIVAVRLIIPFGLPFNILGDAVNSIINHTAVYNSKTPNNMVLSTNVFEYKNTELQDAKTTFHPDASGFETDNTEPNSVPVGRKINIDYQILSTFIGFTWLMVCVALFIKKLTNYYSFVKFVKNGSKSIDDDSILDISYNACQLLGIKKEIPILSNKSACSPMIIGILKPIIVLPDIQLQNPSQLKYVFMHELTHYKRLDIYYKWLIQIILCVHWFNPVVYLARMEINEACELACDEAVIKNLSPKERRAYGDTLLRSFEMTSRYRNPVVSLTLTENSRFMKKRLGAIMIFRKKSNLSVYVSVILTFILCTSAMFTGVYAQNPNKEPNNSLLSIAAVSKSETGTNKDTQKPEEAIKPSRSLLTPTQNSDMQIGDSQSSEVHELEIDIPSVSGKTFVKKYGLYNLTKDKAISANINWNGDGYALLSIPHYDNINVSYNKDKKVQFTEDGNDDADLDKDSTVLEFYNKNSYSADSYILNINGYEASLTFINFSGSKVIYELDYPQVTTVDFSIIGDVTGDYKIAFITENDDIILKASSYFGQLASKPVEIPKGVTKVVLIGEPATGYCNISF